MQNSPNASTSEKHRILILGGGFAGVHTAMELERQMSAAQRGQIEVILVSDENYMVFQPLLPEVVGGTIKVQHGATPIRRLLRTTRVYTRQIQKIDLVAKTVELAQGFQPKSDVVPFDQLVVCLGSRLDYSKVQGMKEHSIPFKYLKDAMHLRYEAVRALEEADIQIDPVERNKLLTFVVAGGGFSGVECIAELHDFLKHAVGSYRNLNPNDVRCVLLQSADRILPEVDPVLAEYAQKNLQRRGIEIRVNVRLKAVSADAVVIEPKGSAVTELLPTRTVVTTVPSAPDPLVLSLPCKLDRGRIVVDAFMKVPDVENLWSLGDCAAVPQPDGITSPPTAQHAVRQAKVCAKNLLAAFSGKPKVRFQFTGLGKLASLGRHSAVAEVMGIKMTGIMAWMAWKAIYLSKIPGWDRKIRVAMDWAFDLVLPRDIAQLHIYEPESVLRCFYHRGETLFNKGDFGDRLFVVIKGEVEIARNGEVLSVLKAGEIFGEIALISDDPRSASAIARTDVSAVAISRSAFQELVTHLPGVRGTVEEIMKCRGFDISKLNHESEPVDAQLNERH
jgi:NADH dehydrogenase